MVSETLSWEACLTEATSPQKIRTVQGQYRRLSKGPNEGDG